MTYTQKTCNTCRHWSSPAAEDRRSRFGSCDRIKHGNETCEGFVDDECLYERPNKTLEQELLRLAREEFAAVTDGSGYDAKLRCKAEFGCTLHEEKA